ncbi:metalloprotease TldD [Gammaproteobacteria bacterium 45_16_T64]|nr:metalloprotease TldD [Gammaproteobacteria bacterium 45_16_T64]
MTSFETATSHLLTPSGLSIGDLDGLLSGAMVKGVDFADLYFQRIFSEGWVLEDGKVKDGSHSIGGGVGVRSICGDKTGFSYSDAINAEAIRKASAAAGSIAKYLSAGRSVGAIPVIGKANVELYSSINPLDSLSRKEKIDLLSRVDAEARQADSRIIEVTVSLVGNWQAILVAASDGTLATDIRPMVRLNVSVILEQAGRRERGSSGGGGRYGYEYFDDELAKGFAREAVRMAQVNMDAVDAPAGTMPVVLGPGWPGVLLHEAVGHGLEGDFNRKGSSTFSGRVGEQVASPLCTVVDDGTMLNRRGSLSVDDEGVVSQKTVLIENGILNGYMQDKLNAKLMGEASTGNGRRESYAHLPMPRMTNTYMLAGKDDPQDIISSVKNGLYAVNFGGGQVDITSGKFVFSASEAYLIEDGKVTRPVKGATLIGNGPEAMNRISAVGHDLGLDNGVGVCGKNGQSVPVGVGQPTLKIDELTVGGTA